MTESTMIQWFVAVTQNLLASFIGVLLGLAFAHFFQERRDRRRYGGWHVFVLKNGEECLSRAISVPKAREIFSETADLSVFLKGVASPYGHINCDLLEQGEEHGMLLIDKIQRKIVIDFDHNPPPPARQPSNAELLVLLKQIAIRINLDAKMPPPMDEATLPEDA